MPEPSRRRRVGGLGHWVKSWALSEPARRIVRALKLTGLAKRIYWLFFHPIRGWRKLRFGDLEARFAVDDFENLFYVDNIVNKNIDEMYFLRALTQNLGPGDSFYDVGASVGIFSILAAQRVGPSGQVISFEPENRSFRTLCENAALNRLTNILLLRLGLGDRETTLTLSMKMSMGLRSSSVIPTADDTPLHQVEIVSGVAVQRTLCLPIPTAVKIDVEGYEAHVLRGMKEILEQPQCRCLCCEVHPSLLIDGMSSDGIQEFIRSLGFNRIDTMLRQSELHLIATKVPPVGPKD